jgi:tRNA-specific 2-thiouridylase
MPLGGLRKTEVREIARKYNLRTAEKAESREICFVVDNDYHRFLKEYEERRGRQFAGGEIVHANGQVIGRHEGTAFYTIGQRKGLGIAWPTPLYVQEIDVANNRVVVGDNDTLFREELIAEQINWVGGYPRSAPYEAEVKIRYLHQPAWATITPLTPQSVHVRFTDKQRAITPGQTVVFYDGDILLGGGLIQ